MSFSFWAELLLGILQTPLRQWALSSSQDGMAFMHVCTHSWLHASDSAVGAPCEWRLYCLGHDGGSAGACVADEIALSQCLEPRLIESMGVAMEPDCILLHLDLELVLESH